MIQTQVAPSTDHVLATILETIAAKGHNYSDIPLATSYEDGTWAVYIDVRISEQTRFDLRTSSPSLTTALVSGLAQLRRQLT